MNSYLMIRILLEDPIKDGIFFDLRLCDYIFCLNCDYFGEKH